jgi:hypothetical protein
MYAEKAREFLKRPRRGLAQSFERLLKSIRLNERQAHQNDGEQ